jgi:hypothetical protein
VFERCKNFHAILSEANPSEAPQVPPTAYYNEGFLSLFKYQTMLKEPAREKHSSLTCPIVSEEEKKVF